MTFPEIIHLQVNANSTPFISSHYIQTYKWSPIVPCPRGPTTNPIFKKLQDFANLFQNMDNVCEHGVQEIKDRILHWSEFI